MPFYRNFAASLIAFLVSLPCFAAPTAILINGGGEPTENNCDFYRDLNRMDRVLGHWDRVRAAADGPGHPGEANSFQCDKDGEPLRDSSSYLILTHTEPDRGLNLPASLTEIRKSALSKAKSSPDDAPFLFYFTDHGNKTIEGNKPKTSVVLWGTEASNEQLASLLKDVRRAKPNGNIILVSDHCYGGGIIQAIIDQGLYKDHVCGFAPANSNEYSYAGQSFAARLEKQVQNSGKKQNPDLTFDQVFRDYQSDPSVSSTPLSTSDLFAMSYFQAHESKLHDSSTLLNYAKCTLSPEEFKKVADIASMSLAINLQNHSESLKKALVALSKKTGLPRNATLADVKKALTASEQVTQHIRNQLDEKSNILLRAQRAWYAKEMTRRFGDSIQTDLNAMKKKIDGVLEKLDSPNLSQDQRDQLKATLESLRKEKVTTTSGPIPYSELDVETNVVFESARSDNPNFAKFVKKNGVKPSRLKTDHAPSDSAAPNQQWPANILESNDTLDNNERENVEKTFALKRLEIALKKSLAIQLMRQDPGAMNDYLTLLECESTQIQQARAPGSLKESK